MHNYFIYQRKLPVNLPVANTRALVNFDRNLTSPSVPKPKPFVTLCFTELPSRRKLTLTSQVSKPKQALGRPF